MTAPTLLQEVIARSLAWRDHRAAHIETCGPCRQEARLAAVHGVGPESLEHCYLVRARDDAATLADALARVREALREIRSCPCGARRESPSTHPHVSGCPIAKAITLASSEPTA